MSVYVDNQQIKHKRMIMCLMFADSLQELLDMATNIDLDHKWLGTDRMPHFWPCKSYRAKAVALGAKEVNVRYFFTVEKQHKGEW